MNEKEQEAAINGGIKTAKPSLSKREKGQRESKGSLRWTPGLFALN